MTKLPYSPLNGDRYSKLKNTMALQSVEGGVTPADLQTVKDDVTALTGNVNDMETTLTALDAYVGDEFMRDQTDAYITFLAGQKTRSVNADVSREGYSPIGIIRIIAERTDIVLRGFGVKTDGVTCEAQFYNMTDASEEFTSKVAFHVIYRKNK